MNNWTARKSNNNRRVDVYSIPGVSEVIYRNEWKSAGRTNRNIESESNKSLLLIVLGIAVALAIMVLTK